MLVAHCLRAGAALCFSDALAGLLPTQGLVAHWDFESDANNVQGDAALDGSLTGGASTDLSCRAEVYRSGDPAIGATTELTVELTGEELRLTDPAEAGGTDL